MIYYTHSERETEQIGERLARVLRAGDVVAMSGDLGAGKTVLIRGLARGLGVTARVTSPTYTIVREYDGRLPLYHLDVYRIGNDPDSIDLDDFLYGDGVTVIEWGNLLDTQLLDDYLDIQLTASGDGRKLDFVAHGPRSQELLEALEGE